MSRALFHCLTLDLISTNPLKCRHQHWLFQPDPKSRPWLTLGKIDRKVQQSFLSSSLPSSSFLLPKPVHLLSNPYQRLSPEKFVPDSGKTELFRVIVVSRNVFYVPPQHFAATDLLIIIAITINTVNQSLKYEYQQCLMSAEKLPRLRLRQMDRRQCSGKRSKMSHSSNGAIISQVWGRPLSSPQKYYLRDVCHYSMEVSPCHH